MSSQRSRRLERLAYTRSKNRRQQTQALRHKIAMKERAELTAPLPEGYDFVRTGNDPPAHVMERALKAMGFPVIARIGLASTAAGIDAAHTLQTAHRFYSSSYLGLARRFHRQPEIFAEFSAAWRLDAGADALKSILSQLWARKEKKP